MLERIKKALVESFVGAIATGWLFADGVMRFVTAITTSLTQWMGERMRQPRGSTFFPSSQFAFPLLIREWVAATLLLVAALLLLRWLYMEPSAAEK